MKKIFTLVVMLSSLVASAQIKNLRFGAGTNFPNISTLNRSTSVELTPVFLIDGISPQPTVSSARISEKYSAKAGVDLSGAFDVSIGKKFLISTGLSFSYLRYTRRVYIKSISNLDVFASSDVEIRPAPGFPISQFYGYVIPGYWGNTGDGKIEDLRQNDNLDQRTSLIAMQIPTLVGTSIFKNKITARAGTVTNFLLNAKVNDSKQTDQFTTVSLCGMASLDYKIMTNLSISVSGQHYFSPIYKDEYRSAGKAKLNSIGVGINYHVRN